MVGAEIRVHGVEETISAMTQLRKGWTGEARWIVGVGAHYGAYVEFGTSRMRAQPYLFPAAEYVMRTRFDVLERRASSIKDLVEMLAVDIEAEAKRRAPVDTGFLRSSIEAFDADKWGVGGPS